MTKKNYVWKGPATTLELFDDAGAPATLIFSGRVDINETIPVLLDESHSMVASWLAFGLIEEVADKKDKLAMRGTKETIDG